MTVLTSGRRAAERLMTDTCVIRKPGTPGPLNSDTDRRTTTPGATVYSGPCKLQERGTQERTPDVAEAQWTVQRYELHLPVVGSEGVFTGCHATVTLAADPTGTVTCRITGAHVKTAATARRLPVEVES